MNQGSRVWLAALLVFALVWSAGGCATYRSIAIDDQSSAGAASAVSSRPNVGDRVRLTLATGERVEGVVKGRTPAVIIIAGIEASGDSVREIDVSAIQTLELARTPLAISSFGGALGTLGIIGVVVGTILLVLDPPFGES